MEKEDIEQQNEFNNNIKEINSKIEDKFNKIKNTHDENEKSILLKELIQENNTKEEYILFYLLFIQPKLDKIEFQKIINENEICISDNNYKKYFQEKYPREKNSRDKIIELISLIKNGILTKTNDKINFIERLCILLSSEKKNLDFICKKEITWDNEELYLHNIYISFLESINTTVMKHRIKSSNEQEFYEGTLFTSFLPNLKKFLNLVDVNFNKKFNNLELKNIDEKLLFEQYILFLSSYNFNDMEKNIKDIWNETFVPLNKIQKQDIFLKNTKEVVDEFKSFNFNEELNQIEIKDSIINQSLVINNIDNYAFVPLINEMNSISDLNTIDFKKYKYIKPTKYKEELFVCIKRPFWKELVINILNSKAYIDIRKSLYSDFDKQINYFSDRLFISKIIDEVIFFLYKAPFNGITLKNSFRIYESGSITFRINKSISLIIFYGSLIIVNIHEIGGHLNAKLHNFYNWNKKFKSSPIINHDEQDKYSNYGNKRGKESGEKVEIGLFGQVVKYLTIKQALFILNINNYKNSASIFKENFSNCNKKDLKELLSDSILKNLLLDLDINISEILCLNEELLNQSYSIKETEYNSFPLKEMRHPKTFYSNNNLLKQINDFFPFLIKNSSK